MSEIIRWDLLEYGYGDTHAVVRQWPNFRPERWDFVYPAGFKRGHEDPGKWEGYFIGTIQNEGWEPCGLALTSIDRGWVKPDRQVKTWMFRRRVVCKVVPGNAFGSQGVERITPFQRFREKKA